MKFEVGEPVYLRTCLCRMKSHVRSKVELSLEFFRSYKILDCIGLVGCKLGLSDDCAIELELYVAQLKKTIEIEVTPQQLCASLSKDLKCPVEPQNILKVRTLLSATEI